MDNSGMRVNDGNGLYDSDGLTDTLIVDCNRLVQQMAAGQYVQYCNTIVGMVQKIGQLKEGIRHDREDRDKAIAELRKLCDDLNEQLTGLPTGDDAPAIHEEELP